MIIVNSMLSADTLGRLGKLCGRIVTLPAASALPRVLSTHPDMLVHAAPDRLICAPEIYDALSACAASDSSFGASSDSTPRFFICFGAGTAGFLPAALFGGSLFGRPLILRGQTDPTGKYPGDTAYNCFSINGALICSRAHTDPAIIEYYASRGAPIHDCRQGYASCSALRLGGNAVITADPSVAAACKKAYADVLLIRPGHILLDGYPYGFIGGCGGLVSPHTLALFGDPMTHPDGAEIVRFAVRYGVKLISVSDGPLRDFGGIINIPA